MSTSESRTEASRVDRQETASTPIELPWIGCNLLAVHHDYRTGHATFCIAKGDRYRKNKAAWFAINYLDQDVSSFTVVDDLGVTTKAHRRVPDGAGWDWVDMDGPLPLTGEDGADRYPQIGCDLIALAYDYPTFHATLWVREGDVIDIKEAGLFVVAHLDEEASTFTVLALGETEGQTYQRVFLESGGWDWRIET